MSNIPTQNTPQFKTAGGTLSEAKVKEGTYRLLALLFQILANPARIKILDLLRNNPPERTFTDVMFSLNMNPNVVSRNLQKLQNFGLIEKTESGHYKITDTGDLALSVTSENVLQIVEKSLNIAKTNPELAAKIIKC